MIINNQGAMHGKDDSDADGSSLLASIFSGNTEQACVVPNPGDLCPVCGQGRMAYDGLLILTCPECGFQVAGGGFT